MGAQNRNANAGGRNPEVGQTHDLPGFIDHLQLLFAVAVVLQRGVVQEEVEGQGVGQNTAHRRPAIEDRAAEFAQLFHRTGTRTASGLVGADHDPTQGTASRQGRQSQGHQNRGAVGVSDHPLMAESLVGIDLGNHQGNPGIHPKRTGVIDHDRPSGGRHGSPLLRDGATRRGEHHIHTGKGLSRNRLNGQLLAVPRQGLTSRAR